MCLGNTGACRVTKLYCVTQSAEDVYGEERKFDGHQQLIVALTFCGLFIIYEICQLFLSLLYICNELFQLFPLSDEMDERSTHRTKINKDLY